MPPMRHQATNRLTLDFVRLNWHGTQRSGMRWRQTSRKQNKSRLGRRGLRLGAPDFFAKDNGFGYVAHGYAALAALFLQHQVSFFFA
jgi:hypothetical protein